MLGRKKFKLPKISSIIAAQTVIEGELRFSGGVHLDGKVQGDIVGQPDGNASLVVSNSGTVEGNVHVVNLVLDGTIVGDVEVDGKVQLLGGARVTGMVRYRMLEMEPGAEVNGKLMHVDESGQRLLEHDSPQAEDNAADGEPTTTA